jgi:D-amino peptidase
VKVFVSVDIEGISGVVHGDFMMPGKNDYLLGRRLMTEDANAAIQGLVEAGADYILVNDGHGPMRNILIEELHPAAHLVSGSGDAKDYCQLEGADLIDFDAAVCIGYHAMAGTTKAIHPHTIAGGIVAEIRLNDCPHGELGLNAAILGYLGIPTIMVSGDQALGSEARAFLPDSVEVVEVKRATGRNAAICRPLASAREDISNAARRAGQQLPAVKSYLPGLPWKLEMSFVTLAQWERASRTFGVERLEPMSVRILGENPWEQYRNLWACIRSGLYEPSGWLA